MIARGLDIDRSRPNIQSEVPVHEPNARQEQ